MRAAYAESLPPEARGAQARAWTAVVLLPVAAVASAASYVAVLVGYEVVADSGSEAPWVDLVARVAAALVYAGALGIALARARRATRLGADGIVPGVAALLITFVSVWVFLAAVFVIGVLAMGLTGTFPEDAPL